jgi:hypothetical protein
MYSEHATSYTVGIQYMHFYQYYFSFCCYHYYCLGTFELYSAAHLLEISYLNKPKLTEKSINIVIFYHGADWKLEYTWYSVKKPGFEIEV